MTRDIHGDDDGRDEDAAVTTQILSGKTWRPFAPDPNDFSWEDLAFSLGRIPRFNGQLPAWGAAGLTETYTVAQHLCLALDLYLDAASDAEQSLDLRLALLLHDAEEALGGLGDPVGPVKHSPQFAPILVPYFDNISRAIAAKAQVSFDLFKSPAVKAFDRNSYAIENYYLRGIKPKPGCSLLPVPAQHRSPGEDFRCWPIGAAGGIWLANLHQLLDAKGIPYE